MIDTLIIANRGEIACRIIRTCRKLGIRTIAVYSDADAHARHVREADEAVHLGASPSGDSYLAIDKIIHAAQRTGADAIHPGFGFLAENADFARACQNAGLIFIGPSPEAIDAMGSKRAAKDLVTQFGVPTIPGFNAHNASDQALIQAAQQIGFPLMVKAAAGGGGKGMRLVHNAENLPDALISARREGLQAFGSDELILEKALINPRHIEIQVLGDQYGHIIHLGERECSIQRRHQKIVEESPSPALTPELRQKMGEAAVTVARAVSYTNAGTVEFLLDADGQFYFLEMNTRLQVEHPVTELVTGLDLVEWQIRIAEGAPLTLQQSDIQLNGHAIEVRLYAEDPSNDFLPVTGAIHLWREPHGEGVRVDSGLAAQDQVSIYYDPMLAKIIAHGADRSTAIRRLIRALENTTLLGLTTNLAFLRDILRHPAFIAGDLSTGFIEQHFASWQHPEGDNKLALIAATLAQLRASANRYWRNNPNRPQLYRYQIPGASESIEVQVSHLWHAGNQYHIQLSSTPEQQCQVVLNAFTDSELTLTIDGHRQTVWLVSHADRWWIHTRTEAVTLGSLSLLPVPKTSADAGGSLRAPMPGSVIAVLVEVGQRVSKGQALMKLEAMKMEHTITTSADGIVEAIYYNVGETVEADAQLLKIG